MPLAVEIVALAVVLFLAQEFVRRAGIYVGLGIWFIGPLVLTPVWMRLDHDVSLFWWVKLYSMLFVCSTMTLGRYTWMGRRRWMRRAAFYTFEANICEAVIQDLCTGQTVNYVNAATGLLVMITLAYRLDTLYVDDRNGHRDAVWPSMTRGWAVGYTLWNWMFVYLNFPALAGQHLAVLTSAAVVSIAFPQLWPQARVYTLTAYLLLLFSFPAYFWTGLSANLQPSNKFAAVAGAVACLLYMIAYSGRLAADCLRKWSGMPCAWASVFVYDAGGRGSNLLEKS
jgi:hypothetical protein